MDHAIDQYIVHETLIEDHRSDGLRSGEGCIEVLPNGSLLLVYGQFKGPHDGDSATLVERRSNDGGLSWSEPKVFCRTPPEVLNLMSVSLLRLADNRLAAVYLKKVSKETCHPCFMTSDDGENWTQPIKIVDHPGYYVVNNDRLVQLSNGRLLVPYAYHGPQIEETRPSTCGCTISDDGGHTWHQGHEVLIESEHVHQPPLRDMSHTEAVRIIEEGDLRSQEPGVVELRDGRVMMWCRSTGGFAYRAISKDGGETWSAFTAITDFTMPCGPQSIKRLPDSDRLIMLFNDRAGVTFGTSQFHVRRPLTIAVSDDDGATWRRHGLLEPAAVPSSCYFSIGFHADNALFTYYEGARKADAEDDAWPRHLASLKLKIVRRAYFQLGEPVGQLQADSG